MEDPKKYYWLLYEYLNRSDKYKKFMKDYRSGKIKPDFVEPNSVLAYDHPVFISAFPYFFSLDLSEDNKFTFDDWWKLFKREYLDSWENHIKKTIVQNYSDFIEPEIDNFIKAFEFEHGCEPTLQDYKKGIKTYRKKLQQMGFQLFIVNVGPGTPTKQKNKIPKLIKDKMEARSENPIRYSELEDYLNVYDLSKEVDKNGKKLYTMRKVIEKIGTRSEKENSGDVNIHTQYRVKKRKAKKIIKNVEKGIFPGNYQ